MSLQELWLAGFYSRFNKFVFWPAMLRSSYKNTENTKGIWEKTFPHEILEGQESENLCTTELAKVVNSVTAPTFLTLLQNPYHFLGLSSHMSPFSQPLLRI